MSERGVFAVDRGVFEHPMFADEPFTEREAWMWLVGLAAYRACQRRIGSAVVDLKRGQAAASVRYLAEKWQWKAARVQRFLARLKKEAMIDTAADTGITVISINNYSKYQKVALPADTPNEQAPDTPPIQQRYKEEGNKNTKQDSEEPIGSSGADAPPVYTDSRHELWGEAVPILMAFGQTKRAAGKLIGSWLKQTGDDAQQVLGAIQRARDHRPHGPIAWITNALKTPGTINGQRAHRATRTNEASVVAALVNGLEGRNGEAPRPADADIPRGRFELDLEPAGDGGGDSERTRRCA